MCPDATGHNFYTGAIPGTAVLNVSQAGTLVKCGALGYAAGFGVGGAVTQTTSKSTTPPTINKSAGQITTHNAALASNTVVFFTVNDSQVTSADTVNVTLQSGHANSGTYEVWAESPGSGTFKICIRNISGGSLSEALVLNFTVTKGAAS
jgi:hypothetical protein